MYSKIRKDFWSVLCACTLLITIMLPQTVQANETQKLSNWDTTTTQNYLLEDWVNLEIQFFGSDTYNSVTQNMYLPTSGNKGSYITWASSNTNIITNTGVVTRSTEDKYITMTATLYNSGLTEVKVFNLVVLKQEVSVPQVSIAESFVAMKGDTIALGGYVYSDSLLTSITIDITDNNFSSSKVNIKPEGYYYDLSNVVLSTSDNKIVAGNTYTIRIWVKSERYQEDKVIATTKLQITQRGNSAYETLKGPQREIYYFNQYDSNYKYYQYGELTLGDYGSGPSAMAMVISSLTDQNIDPIYMANWSVTNKHYNLSTGSSHTLIPAAAIAHNLSVEGVNPFNNNNETAIKRVSQALKEGKLVIALLTNVSKPSFGQRGEQFIVLRGITEDGKILIADSADDTYRTRSNKSDGYTLQTIINESKVGAGGGGPLWIISRKEAIPKVTGLESSYSLISGGKLTLAGMVTGETNLSNLSVVISNIVNGKVTSEAQRVYVYPNSRSYDLRYIGLNTSVLKVGEYKIRVYGTTLTDIKNNALLYEANLTVTGDADQVLNQDTNKLSIGYSSGDNSNYVTGQLKLPIKGESGSSVTWVSSNTNVINISNNEIGNVYRQDVNTNVTLTAILTYGNKSKVKVFQLTVISGSKLYVSGYKEIYEVAEGGKVTLSGAVNSSTSISAVKVTIEGQSWYSMTKWPYTKSYNLDNFTINTKDKRLNLKPGTYTIKIWASNTWYIDEKTPIATMKLKVLANDSDRVNKDKKNIKIVYAKGDSWKKITKNITLPKTGANGSTIFWTSKNEKVISSTGIVNRPTKKDVKVTMVATIVYGNDIATREIVLTVKAKNSNNGKNDKHNKWYYDWDDDDDDDRDDD